MIEISEDQLDRFEKLATKLLESQPTPQNANTQTLSIDAGGKALWFVAFIATICCVVTFIVSLDQRDRNESMQLQLNDVSRKLDVAQDKLSIILQWAPNLRDEVNKEMKDRPAKP